VTELLPLSHARADYRIARCRLSRATSCHRRRRCRTIENGQWTNDLKKANASYTELSVTADANGTFGERRTLHFVGFQAACGRAPGKDRTN